MKGLGYRYTYDPRAEAHLMATNPRRVPKEKFWDIGPILDQGREGACVGFAWTAWRNAHPVPNELREDYALSVYRRAQTVDEWPGEAYEGTSNQAGAKVMAMDGALNGYVWGKTYEDFTTWIKTTGPVVLAMPWYEGMYETDGRHFIRPRGNLVGGHALLCFGVSRAGSLKVQNSWGTGFGDGGTGWIAKDDWLWLASQDRGWSACAAAEIAR